MKKPSKNQTFFEESLPNPKNLTCEFGYVKSAFPLKQQMRNRQLIFKSPGHILPSNNATNGRVLSIRMLSSNNILIQFKATLKFQLNKNSNFKKFVGFIYMGNL